MKEQYRIVGEGFVRKRKDGSWEGRYTIENINTGVKKPKSFYGKLRRDVQAKMTAYADSLNEPQGYAPSDKVTVSEWMDTWLDVYKATSIRAGTREKYRLIIANKIKPGIGSMDIRTIDDADIQTFLNGLSPTLAGKQINEVRAVLLAALDKAVDKGLIPYNPARKTSRSYEEHHKIVAMTVKEQTAFLKAAEGSRYALLYQLALATGMRRGELLGLCWEDIDLNANVIRVREAVTKIGTALVKGEVKSQSGVRDIPIPSALLPVLRDSMGSGLIFQYSTGTPVNPSYILRSMKTICDKAGIPQYNIKDLRSTFATRAAERGVNPKILMTIMGHSKVEVTLRYYTSATYEMKQQAMDAVFSTT